jgi:trimeric autotransporter adhesin
MSASFRLTARPIAITCFMLIANSLCAASAHAVEVCVNSVGALNAQLILGQFSSQPLKIDIVQGTYLMGADGIFTLSGPTTLEGGYTANCASRVANAANTVINLQGHAMELTQPAATPSALIAVDGLTFINGDHLHLTAGTFGLISDDDGKVRLSNARVTDLVTNTDIPFYIVAFNNGIDVENVVVDHISNLGSSPVAVVFKPTDGGALIANHLTADLSSGDRISWTQGSGNVDAYIYNSVLWSSGGGTASFFGGSGSGSTTVVVNSIFSQVIAQGVVNVQNQINSNPLWVNPSAGDYRLQNASPAVNSGTLFAPGGEPATDIEGKARIIGSAPDRGAYESLVSDLGTVLVTNTLDSGAGSLRDAINIANSLVPPPKVITFNIPGPCPAVIALNSVLPTINGRMIIDGYTQPASTRNTSATGFNANLCVLLKPASGTLNYAFTVPANSFGSLVLRGLGIGGFSQPVRILGGQNSQLVGNQFGGTVGGVALPGAGLNAITFASSASGDILVGGNALGDRNLIGGAAQNGIDSQTNATTSFTTCSIVNNLVGMDRDGHTQLANAFGINVSGSGCQIVGNRIAGNTITNLWINSGSSNIVQQNLIGFTNQDLGFFTNTTGILVTGSNNVIGAGGNGGSFTANTVRYNIAGGVVVKGDSALGNSVNANRIYDNGASNNGMDIDLLPTGGNAGPTPNDSGDGDAGPNQLQNFPIPKSLVYTGPDGVDGRPGNLSFLLDSAPGIYRVDVYFSNATNPTGKRGHAETILTHTTVQVPASGRLSFTLPILVPSQSAGGVISLTATDAGGNTSEIGTALSTDSIFTDGLD